LWSGFKYVFVVIFYVRVLLNGTEACFPSHPPPAAGLQAFVRSFRTLKQPAPNILENVRDSCFHRLMQ
jgi:hypothetical protein